MLAEGIEINKFLTKLTLSRLSIGYSKSFVLLISAIQENPTLEYLDLSENIINDDAGSFISCLIESNSSLKILKLDHNKIKDFSFALSLTKNKSLVHFSICYNPLEFVNMISLLEMLTINKYLQCLEVAGIVFKGPAPIKENPSGFLNTNEAIILKLANVLRYSNVVCICIDIDPDSQLQLKELEITIVKHNRTLVKLESALINWTQVSGNLLGIYRGLKANQWLCDRNTHVTKDIQEIINLKTSHKKNESLNSSADGSKYSQMHTPIKVMQDFKISRKNSFESKNSDATVIENKLIKEMSFGKSTLSKYLKEDDSFVKYLQNINDKIFNLEQNFSTYVNKTDSYMERIESKIQESQRSEEIASMSVILKDIQSRLDKFEADKTAQSGIVEDYIQKLESLKFSKDSLQSSRRSSRRLRPSKKNSEEALELKSFEGTQSVCSDSLEGKIVNIDERLQKLEKDSYKVKKVKQRLKGTNVINN